MAQNTKIRYDSSPTNANPGSFLVKAIASQKIERESCSNPLKMGKVL